MRIERERERAVAAVATTKEASKKGKWNEFFECLMVLFPFQIVEAGEGRKKWQK
jgi:hypothetical protein